MKSVYHYAPYPTGGLDLIGENGEQLAVEISVVAGRVWVNINGQCVMRIANATEIHIDDRSDYAASLGNKRT